ncbi:hypothetical protein PHLCEN_2v2328 [Hermanssonia centrifuga]|uniref:C2H2-type domain-containing protein n=1 Tax=Hermanssonia centrifuga TaxID=98765 RepID=A0A2R6RPE9_9APHY|nr:hypothetical protein PHLCEN_2v2328 [Hermanssonia centrifuga]
MPRTPYNVDRLPCLHCKRIFRNVSGLTQHRNAHHGRPRGHLLPAQQQHDLERQPSPLDDIEIVPTTQDPDLELVIYHNTHKLLNGRPCDSSGKFLADPEAPPPPRTERPQSDWTPYNSRLEFETAEFLFQRVKMGQGNVDMLLELWAASLVQYNGRPPFASVKDMLSIIDSTPLGDAPWVTRKAQYNGPLPQDPPPWITAHYEICFRNTLVCAHNMISNPDFADEFDVAPYREYDGRLERRYTNLMSGDWAWSQADIISKDPDTHGTMFCPMVLGSDKTTVSVAMGQNDYYPLYMSWGNVWNNVRKAHRNAVTVVAFLAIPKGMYEPKKRYAKDPVFRKFCRQLFHSSLATILQPLKPFMTKPEIVRCANNLFRRAIYGLGPYIADYLEQVLTTNTVQGWCVTCPTPRPCLGDFYEGPDLRVKEHTELLVELHDLKTLWEEYGVVGDLIPFTNDFPRADICQLISGDLLHQIIKGCFKDHLVEWVNDYLKLTHGETKGNEIIDQIDRRIAAVPAFTGIQRFKQGRNFKQWMGDNSKALMKTEDTVTHISACLRRYHALREIFRTTGTRPNGFHSYLRHHAIDHYPQHIANFGAPNGLCSSITESKHIKAVKEPWRRSNKYNALSQMLETNQRTDKLAAAHVDFAARHMLQGSCLLEAIKSFLSVTADDAPDNDVEMDTTGPRDEVTAENAGPGEGEAGTEPTWDYGDVVEGSRVLGDVSLAKQPQRNYPKTLKTLGRSVNVPHLPQLVSQFLYDQTHLAPLPDDSSQWPPCPPLSGSINVFHSAAATFYAPSDLSGIGGMQREHIRATPSWYRGPPRYDCVLAEKDPSKEGFRGLHAAQVRLLMSFSCNDIEYPCALVRWFSPVGDEPDDLTGMWVHQQNVTSAVQLKCNLQ